MFTENALWDGSPSTLGDEFARLEPRASLGGIERAWFDAMTARETTDADARKWIASLRNGIRRIDRGGAAAEDALNGLLKSARDALYPRFSSRNCSRRAASAGMTL